jgi:hypothetical protein
MKSAIYENTAVGIRHADHVAPSIRKTLALTSLTSGGRSVGIVLLRTEATEFFLRVPCFSCFSHEDCLCSKGCHNAIIR